MTSRTTIVLDEPSRDALDDLSRLYRCSASEAIRRAVVQQRNQLMGVSEKRRQDRMRALQQLIELSHGGDAEGEVARLKAEDARS